MSWIGINSLALFFLLRPTLICPPTPIPSPKKKEQIKLNPFTVAPLLLYGQNHFHKWANFIMPIRYFYSCFWIFVIHQKSLLTKPNKQRETKEWFGVSSFVHTWEMLFILLFIWTFFSCIFTATKKSHGCSTIRTKHQVCLYLSLCPLSHVDIIVKEIWF